MGLRKRFSVLGLRKAYELRGIDCDESYAHREHKKSMMISRSFGSPLTDADCLQEIIALFITRAGEKLRQQKLKTNALTLMLKTSPFSHTSYQSHCLSMTLEDASDDTIVLLKAAQKIFAQIYQKGTLYKKAGILMEPLTQGSFQQKLFSIANPPTKQRHKLYETLDQVNQKWGRGTLRPASCGTKHQTSGFNMTRRENLSSAFTTSWKELLMVK